MIKKIIISLMAIFIVLFLAAVIGFGILVEMHSFQASVSGKITDTQGNPIHGAKVKLYIGGSDGSSNDYQKVTNESGFYSIQTARLRYALDSSAAYRGMGITADGYVPISVKKRVAKGNNSNWNFELTEAICISGRLVNSEGEPMANSSLSFLPIKEDNGESFFRNKSVGVKTDSEGNFELNNVGPFEYRILRHEHGLNIYRQRPVKGEHVDLSDVANCNGLEICINEPRDFAISGHIKDSDGNSIPRAYVWTHNEYPGTWGTFSDQEGAFCIIGLDGLGKEVFDIGVKGKTSQGESFKMVIPDVKLHSENLSFVVQ